MNTGKSANFHKIYKTGQSIPKNLIQIWDVLSNKKLNSAIWGTMNTNFRDSPQIKVFPDPWNKQTKSKTCDTRKCLQASKKLCRKLY